MSLGTIQPAVLLRNAGFRLEHDDELGGFCAVKNLQAPSGRRRKLAVTKAEGDGIPSSINDVFSAELFEHDGGDWELLVSEEYDGIEALFAGIEGPEWKA